MSWKRRTLKVGAWLTGLLVVILAAGILVVRSQWFYNKIRLTLIDTVETATGGRVEIGSFGLDWAQLRAEVRSFVIHGNEPADRPPLFRASSISVGLKIVSLAKRDIDIRYLNIADPRIYLMVYPDGRTNVPEPKIKAPSDRNAVETILALAIGRFDIRNGIFEVEARGQTPFDARGQNLTARFDYAVEGPRYNGQVSIQPLDLQLPGFSTLPLGIATTLTMERNRITLSSATLKTGGTHVEFSGAIDDLSSPHGSFQYSAHVAVPEAARFLKIEELDRGTVEVAGNATWTGGGFSATGNLRTADVEYRDSLVRLSGYRLEGALTANPSGVDLNGVNLTGLMSSSRCASPPCMVNIPVEGRIANITVRGPGDLDLHRVTMNVLGGTYQGEARLRALDRYTVDGEIAGFNARRVIGLYSPERLPWDGVAAGPVHLQGSFKRKMELKANGDLTISPAAESAPVHGQITAAYEVSTGILDLGHSTITLPSSRADFSGAFGKRLQAHFESRDLNDILPVLGQSAADMPVKLENGTATFDGTVSGKLDYPQFDGHVTATRFAYQGKLFDSLEGDASVSPDHVQMQKGTVVQGSLHAQFQGSATLVDWKAGDASAISASGSLRNASVQDLATLLDVKNLPASGTLSVSGQVSGTVGNPSAGADLEITKGTVEDESFDRFTGHLAYAGRRIELTAGQVTGGAKQIQIAGAFAHLPNRLDTGRLHLQVRTNVMPLDQIQTLQKLYPGVRGTAQVSATAEADLAPSATGQMIFRLADLQADVTGKSLQLTGQSLGDTHLTATSQGQVLRAHLESDFANSQVRGDGQWRLEGDYTGSGTIRFSKLDFAQLRAWTNPADTAAARVSGSAEGELQFEGPALKPEAIKAQLRVPKFEVGPAPGTVPAAGAITLTNAGPIVASMANYVVTVESARLVGRATDLSVTGRVLLQQKNPLDLRVNGRADLGVVQEFDSDIIASGAVTADATVRGAFDAPLLNGRVQIQDASFGLTDLPIGISKANGVVLLSNDRATIQNFTGETGGGKITLTGFAGYSGGDTIFRFHARAEQVRVRYPEGVSTVANGSLNLTGTPSRSMLDGSITILRTGFNLQSDFSSIIAQSAEPVRTPAARTGLLGGLNFDIQINTDPDIQLQSALTEDLQAEANLRLRGTASNPAIVGRINITQGQVVFYGTKYNINQGTIAFYNPLKVDPILDVDLETKAHGVDITLTVAGPLNKLHLTPRSDPPLQFSEIVALLATGRTPTSDPTLLVQQSTAPQSWQQMGATALLGQAIANPVAGRLQRFFGVSKLRIDPTLPGVENNPQARLTLEQQVTPDITFTYITNVTNSNPQVVRMEWAFSKQWSVVALRDENGTFGLDFFYKKRF